MSKSSPLIGVIDDEEAVRKALGRLLLSAGLAVVTFSGGEEFLHALRTVQPDCAVLDLHMPEVTGFDVLMRLAEKGSRMPVVVITGHDTAEAEELAMRNGAAAYLRKPINDRVLLETISAAIAKSTQDQNRERPGAEGGAPAS